MASTIRSTTTIITISYTDASCAVQQSAQTQRLKTARNWLIGWLQSSLMLLLLLLQPRDTFFEVWDCVFGVRLWGVRKNKSPQSASLHQQKTADSLHFYMIFLQLCLCLSLPCFTGASSLSTTHTRPLSALNPIDTLHVSHTSRHKVELLIWLVVS